MSRFSVRVLVLEQRGRRRAHRHQLLAAVGVAMHLVLAPVDIAVYHARTVAVADRHAVVVVTARRQSPSGPDVVGQVVALVLATRRIVQRAVRRWRCDGLERRELGLLERTHVQLVMSIDQVLEEDLCANT